MRISCAVIRFRPMLLLSSSAMVAIRWNSSTLRGSDVSIPSFSKNTLTPNVCRRRIVATHSRMLRENRAMDFVRIRSILPASQSASSRPSSGRPSIFRPDFPWSP